MSYQDDGRSKLDLGNIVAGLFLGCFGLFGVLLGGGCGLIIINEVGNSYADGSWMFLLIALAIFAGGCTALYQGIKLMTRRD